MQRHLNKEVSVVRKPEGLDKFHKLLSPLSKVPKRELARELAKDAQKKAAKRKKPKKRA